MKRTLALTVVTALCAVSPFVAGAAMSSLQQVAGLRRADQELLRGGITVGSQEQLLLLLEDLGS